VRILVAPDKFKGTLTAPEVAAAIARGWRRTDPRAEVVEVPLADGGDGTLDALVTARGGQRRRTKVTGPDGCPVEAEFGLVEGSSGPVGVIEMARASGLVLVPPDQRDPVTATSRGTGELMVAAVRAGATRLVVAVGGSATNDAGAGMAQALGVRFLDDGGRELGPGGRALLGLQRVDAADLAAEMRGVPVEVLIDVDNPLLGPQGASAVFGPQKGASPVDIALLDRALTRFADVVRRDTGGDVGGLPGTGAAGGIGASLVAFLGATFRSGVDAVMDATEFRARLSGADVVVTGEGTFDAESLRGKVVGAVLGQARAAGAGRVLVICGSAVAPVPPGVELVALADRFGLDRAMQNGAALLEDVSAEAAGAGRVRR
jgi:glycerate 2-kinase